MKTILEFIRQELQETSYYLGTLFWAAASVLAEIAKMKKNAIDSGLASIDQRYIVSILNWSMLLVIGIALIFMLQIWAKLRQSFTSDRPTLWQYGLSWTWMSIRATLLAMLLLVPSIIYALTHLEMIAVNPFQFGTYLLINLVLTTPFSYLMIVGAGAILIARGNSHRSIRDGVRAVRHIWREILLTLLLSLVPMIIVAPIRLLSFKFHALEIIAIGLNACFAPYSFGVMGATYLYLGKRLLEKAPALVTSASAQ